MMKKFSILILLACILLSGCSSDNKISNKLGAAVEKYGYSPTVSNANLHYGFYIVQNPTNYLHNVFQQPVSAYNDYFYAFKSDSMRIGYADFANSVDAINSFNNLWDRTPKDGWTCGTADYKISLKYVAGDPYTNVRIVYDNLDVIGGNSGRTSGYYITILISKENQLMYVGAVGNIANFTSDLAMINDCCTILGNDISFLQDDMLNYLQNSEELISMESTPTEVGDSSVISFGGWN